MCEKIDWDAYEKDAMEELIEKELRRIEQARQQEEEKRQCIVLSVIGFILVLILILLS